MTSQMQLFLKLIQLFLFLINTILVWDLRVDMFPGAENKECMLIGKGLLGMPRDWALHDFYSKKIISLS